MHGFLKWEGRGDAWCVQASSPLGLRVPFAVTTVALIGGQVGSLSGSLGLSKGAAPDRSQRHFCEILSSLRLTLPL